MKKIAIIAITVIIILIGVGFQKSSRSVNNKNPIKIGVVYALSGIAGSWTEIGKVAADMAVEEINAAGGVNGRPMELIYQDSETNPAKSVSAFQKLVTIDKVDAVIGDVWAFLTNPLIPLADQNKIVLISPTVMDTSVEKPGQYFFTLGHQMSGIEPAINKFFDQYPDVKTAGLLCWGVDAWGLTYTAAYEKVAKERNIKIIEKVCTTDFSPDYRSEAAKIKAAKPDVVLVNGLGDRAINTLRTFGVTVPIVADSNALDGFETRGTVTLDQLKDVYVIYWLANDDFIKKFLAKSGKYPILEAQNSYEAVMSIAKGFENNPNDLLVGIRKVKYDSSDGLIDFTTGTSINPNKRAASLYVVMGKGNYEVVK